MVFNNSPHCTGDYRYGFNGKEKDDSGEWGSSAIYDYGFRIYNPGIAKFLSVDPLTKSYPMLTPYQFASNRPIDGIDLDGLEYYTYMIYFQNGKKIKTTLVDHTDLEDGYGSQGPGVEYIKVELDSKGKVISKKQVRFIENNYGVYAGADPNNPQNDYRFKGDGYDYYLPAIDETDQVAKEHDMAYDAVGATGESDFWDNPYTIEADVKAVQSWNTIDGKGAWFRWQATTLFTSVINKKKNIAIRMWFKEHGYGEIRHSNQLNNMANKLGGKQKVYEMWREENMVQDENGTWIKKDKSNEGG